MNAYKEIERLAEAVMAPPALFTAAQRKALDDILLKCRGYMEPDLNSEGLALGLTPNRARMFDLLLARKDQVVSRAALLDVCMSDEDTDIKIVDVNICHIRKRLQGSRYEIETVWGRGYRLKPEAKRAHLKAA